MLPRRSRDRLHEIHRNPIQGRDLVRPPRDPTRRNRNIGTAKQGHGAGNEMSIPGTRGDPFSFWEDLNEPREFRFQAHGDDRVVYVEKPRPGEFYGCTPLDLARLIPLLPEDDVLMLDVFVFRQPTRKQRQMSSVWGRILYSSELVTSHGASIIIESQSHDLIRWNKSLNPERQRELRRLEADGHHVSFARRGIEIRVTAESHRKTVLERTLLHEIGHWVDRFRDEDDVEHLSELDRAARRRAHETRPQPMIEDWAHRYADTMAAKLRARGELPFPPQWDDALMARVDMPRAWFA